MKKIIIVGAAILFSAAAGAQSRFGLNGAAVFSNVNESFEDESEFNGKSRVGYKIGLTGYFPVAKNFSIMPQLSFVNKGTRINESFSMDFMGMQLSYEAKGFMSLNYLELPVFINYTTLLRNGNTFLIGAGPSFSYGLSGKAELDVVEVENGNRSEYTESSKVKFDGKSNMNASDDYGHYKAFELGIAFNTGYMFRQGLMVNFQVNQGLSNINTDAGEGGKTKNFYASAGLIWFFR